MIRQEITYYPGTHINKCFKEYTNVLLTREERWDEEGREIYFWHDSSTLENKYFEDGTMTQTTFSNITGVWSKKTYDNEKRLIKSEDRNGVTMESKHDEKGRQTFRRDGNIWTAYKYDERGNVIYKTNEVNYWKRTTYNENNQILTEEVDGFKLQYNYDADGQRISETNLTNGLTRVYPE